MRIFYSLLMIFLLYTSYVNGQLTTDNHVLIWQNDTMLTFEDFWLVCDDDQMYDARSNVQLYISYQVLNHCIEYNVFSKFYRDESCMKIRSNPLLKHESGHFNITELYARKIKYYLFQYSDNDVNVAKIKKDVDSIYADYNNIDSLYDAETFFSNNAEQQKKWDAYINKELRLLDNFTQAKATVYIKRP